MPAAPTRTRANPAIDRKDPKSEVLLEVASQTFLEEGFAGSSMGQIARRAHASKETFYSRYESKEQLFEAVMRRLVDRFSGELSGTMVPSERPEKVLTALAEKFLRRLLSDEEVAFQKIIQMEANRFPALAKLFFELGPQRTMRSLGQYFAAQVAQKRLRPLDGETAAGHFMGMLIFDLSLRRSLGLLKELTPQEIDHRIKAAVDTFMRAYGPISRK